MGFDVGEETVKMPGNARLNQYNTMQVISADTPQALVKKLAEHRSQLFIKTIYYSPTDKSHVAYVLSNENLTKGNEDGS